MKIRYRFASLVLALFMVISLGITDSESVIVNAGAKTNKEIQSEIDTLSARMNNITNEQKALKAKISQAQSDANSLSAEISNLNYEIALIDEISL